jgi:hypothetical protein
LIDPSNQTPDRFKGQGELVLIVAVICGGDHAFGVSGYTRAY